MKHRKRRQLIIASGQGVALLGVGQWHKPIVQHTVLPAHAATTDTSDSASTATTTFDPTDILRDVIIPLVLSKSPHQ